MVDASTSYRMNPLASLSIDRNALMGENYHHHGAIFYPSIHPLSSEKPQEPGTSLPLGYELLYKPDVTPLDGQKPTNGYVGLYKTPPPGMQKPVVPVAGGDGLRLDRQVLSNDKQSELSLNGAASFLRLPWISPYADATMYPFLDMAYKASFLSQPSPLIHQQLAYQSLCATGAGSSAPGEDRLFYLPHYAPAHISSPLAPPIRIHRATPAPAVLSPLSHCQDKVLQGLDPHALQEHSAFSTSPQIHQEPQPQSIHHTERQHSCSDTKSSQSISTNNTQHKSGGSSSIPVNSSASTAALESPPCSVSLPQPHSNSTTNLQKSLYRSTSSSSTSLSVSRPFYMGSSTSEHLTPMKSGSSKTKDASSDCCSAERCISPAQPSLDRAVPQMPTKSPGEKPLDLSAKDLEELSNGFPSKLEALAKLGYLPASSYGLVTSQEHLKEGLLPPVSKPGKSADQPEMISTMASPWVVPGSSSTVSSEHNRGSQIMKNKSVDHHPHPQSSPGSTAVEVNSIPSPVAGRRSTTSSPSPNSKVEWPRLPPKDLEKVHSNSKEETHTCHGKGVTLAKLEAQESQSHRQQQQKSCLENWNSSNQICDESYLPPGLGYTNRYIPYSVAENMSLQRMTIPGKGPVYPHPVLLGSSSFYPPRIAPKHGLAYGVHPNQGDFITYQNSRGLGPPPVSSHPGHDRLETQDKSWNSEPYRNQEKPNADASHKCGSERDKSTNQTAKASRKSLISARDDIVLIDLVRDEADDDLSTNKQSSLSTVRQDSSKHGTSGYTHVQEREPWPPKGVPHSQGAMQKQGLLPHTSQSQPPHHNSSSPPPPPPPDEEVPEQEEPLSPFPDIPEEQTMHCARTCPRQFSRKCKTGVSVGGGDLTRTHTGSADEKSTSTEAKTEASANKTVNTEQSPSRNDRPLGLLSKDSCSSGCKTSTITGAVGTITSTCHSDSQVGSSKGPGCRDFSPPVGGVMNTRAPPCVNINPRCPHNSGDVNNSNFVSRNFVGPCCRNVAPKAPTCEPRIFSSNAATPNCRSINLRLTNCENRNVIRPICGTINLRVPACGKNCFSCPNCGNATTKAQSSANNQTCLKNSSSPPSNLGPTSLPLSAANLIPEAPLTKDQKRKDLSTDATDPSREMPNSTHLATAGCDDGKEDIQDDVDPLADDDEGTGCSKNRRSGLTKRIANSSGYVGDRFKCVTTELYADSSKLSREQRALQRAMLRFSELELKEKEGGRGEDEEEQMTAMVAAGETELADGQQGNGEREEEEQDEEEEEGRKKEGGGGGWECCQWSERRQEGGGRIPSAAATQAQRGFHPSCPHNHLHILCRHSDSLPVLQEKHNGSAEEQKKNEEGGGGMQEQKRKEEEQRSFVLQTQQQRFLSTARSLFQGNGSMLGLGGSNLSINRRRLFSLEPFHQSSISSSRTKRGREEDEEEGEEDRAGNANKKNKFFNDSTLEDVKKLKVCIELNGLRLNKPRLPVELSQWRLASVQRSAGFERKFRMDVPIVRARSEVNGGWCDRAFVKRDEPRVFHVAPPYPCSSAPRGPPPASFTSFTTSRLQDKHQKLRESRRLATSLPSLPPSSSSPDLHPFHCHDDDLNKPKGKRPCKTKHTGEVMAREEEREGGGGNNEKKSGKISPSDPSHSPRPPSPQHTLATRPVPPEVRRLIVNKNAGETLLQRAARLGYEEVVLYCLERRICDVNHRDNAGYCALHEACARGWLGIVRHLVEHGADINCSAQDGTRPLHDAVENDHVDVVRFLLACGADPTLTSYSGRGPINMTHSATMETFLEDYLSDLQGRSEGDPGIYWEFYGSSVCEPSSDVGGVHNILADPPGPDEEEEDEEEDEDEEQRARREVFEFELSDQPLLPCYNIQVSLSQGPRNWLLLADVLGRLRMTSRSFRRLFPQLNVQSIPEDEFYRQASLSQLLTGPDEQELASFRPDVKDLLELVEATPELAGMLGSSLEFVDTRWDSLEVSPPPTPPPPPSQRLLLRPLQGIPPFLLSHRETEATLNNVLQNRTAEFQGLKNLGYSPTTAKMETKINASMWEPKQPGSENAGVHVPLKPNVTMKTNMWELQRQQSKNTWISNSANPDSNTWEQQPQQSKDTGIDRFANPDPKIDCEQQQGNKPNAPVEPDVDLGASMREPQRLRSRSTANSDTNAETTQSEAQRTRNKSTANCSEDADTWKRQNQESKTDRVLDSPNPGASVVDSVWEPQRLRNKNAGTIGPAKLTAAVDTKSLEHQGIKRVGGTSTAPKGEADHCANQSQGGKTIKMDPAWQRNLGNVRVHIRDLGMKVGGGTIRRDVKKEQGKPPAKGARVKTRS